MSTILPIAQDGEPILRIQAALVAEDEFNSAWLHGLADAMQATMLFKQGIGIAAPQIYVSKRVIIVASRPNQRYPDAPLMQETVMVNPVILNASDAECDGEEGCLSIADTRGVVRRAVEVTVEYFTLAGIYQKQTFSGFPARVIQHEIDHLNGILFTDYEISKK